MTVTLSPGLRRAVSPYVGIVRSVEECLHAPTEPPLFEAASEVGGGSGLLGSPLDHLSGIGGAARTRGDAFAAAVGEALERYSASYVPSDRLVVATARELGDAAVRPERFALFSARQYAAPSFSYRCFTSDTRIAWVAGRTLPAGRPAFLPAELVFLARGTAGDGAPIGYATSSGAACGATVEETVVRGLCELLERDAFMIVWANRLSLPQLEPAPGTPLAELDRELFARTGLAYSVVDLSVFHRLPCALGVVRAPSGTDGALGVGAGTAPTIEQAWWKGLAEAFASRAAGAKLALLDPGRDLGPHGAAVGSFDEHIVFHADHRNFAAGRFLDASELRAPVDSVASLEGDRPAGLIAALCARVEAAESSAYAVDVTSPDVAELGLTVTKTVAPELCSLDVSHAARFLGGRRLYEEAAKLGLREDVLRESDVNPEPHPFP